MKSIVLVSTFIIYALLFPQCKPPAESASADVPLTETYWKLTEVYGKPLAADTSTFRTAHLIFRNEENRVEGNGSCNSISGTYTLSDNNRIVFSNMISTKMACPNLDVEAQFLNALQVVDGYRIKGDTLMLTKAETDVLAKLARSASPLPASPQGA